MFNTKTQVCYWCEHDFNTGAEVPDDKRQVRTYNPCSRCQAVWDRTVNLIEVTDTPSQKNQPAISTDVEHKGKKIPKAYPTGRAMGISVPMAKMALDLSEFKGGQEILKAGANLFVEEGFCDILEKRIENMSEEEQISVAMASLMSDFENIFRNVEGMEIQQVSEDDLKDILGFPKPDDGKTIH